MRASDLFGNTLRDAPTDAEIPSHRLLIRGAFLRRVAAGIYSWLPLGLRVLRNVEQIVREEMNSHGGVELLMPALLPKDLLDATGRWETFGVELYRLEDLSGRQWYLGPTHEEVITALAATELPSYKDLPSIPYQIQWKYRYAPRPRGGLLRGREFLMKDAYSFDVDEAALTKSYDAMLDAYTAIFERCGLSTIQIEAHAGVIGGTVNHEFTQPAAHGEDTFVRCDNCDYAANTEAAISRNPQSYEFGSTDLQDIHTPDAWAVEEVAKLLKATTAQFLKALMYRAGDEVVCALIPGDRELNEYKLSRALGGVSVEMLTDEEFKQRGWPKGYLGPNHAERVFVERSLEGATGLIGGAGRLDYHQRGIEHGRDFTGPSVDLLVAIDGDACDKCGGALSIEKGIEVGHVFQLGTKYSDAMSVSFTDESGARRPYVMGCYGLGVSRVVASIVEAHNDERGISWPRSVAPAQIVMLDLGSDGEAARLAKEFSLDGTEIVLDDRQGVSAGVKFADADLIGYPLQLVCGKKFAESKKLEFKIRRTGERGECDPTSESVSEVLTRCP